VMPQSKEVLECRRATTSLLGGLARLRLTGATLSSPVRQPFKDTQLINAFLSAEGARFIQLGTVVCSAIKDGTLYLNAEAVELILASFEEMLSSYAYSRDEGLLRLALSFMTCSMPYWLVPELSTSDLTDRVVYLAKFLATKALRDQVPSWRVRLAILLFADEYLDYDPSFSAWSSLQMDDATDDDAWGPLAVTSGSLLDRDGRVRFRAATSTAGLFYLQSIPPGQHYPFYEATMNRLPRQPKHWDSFITDIVWKLNCCVTSAQLRAATIYHLYEVPLSSSDFNHHLQIGLAAVAQRLGLDGISTLYLPYAALVVRSQLGVNQSPMRVPYRVYGSSSHKAFAASLLGGVSPSILAAINGEAPCKDGNRAVTGARELFASLCEAASLPLQEVVKRHLPATLALVSANLVEDATFSPDKDLSSPLIDALTALPGITAEADVDRLVPGSIDLAAAYLFGLVDLEASALEIGKLLDTRIKNGEPGSLFVDLMRSDVSSAESPPALHPSFPTGTIINAYGALSTIGISMSTSKMVFNALANLFHRLNETFLVSEQRRYLRSIALVTATHQAEYRQPAVLEMSLREAIMLLDRRDICALVLSFVKWGLQQIPKLSPAIGDLADIFIRLGAAWNRLKGLDNPAADVADDMESWISRSALSWQNDEAMVRIIPVVLTLWPSQLAQYFKSCPEPTFGDLCDLAASSRVDDVSILMKRLVGKLTEGNLQANVVELQQRAFWHLKKAINPASFDEEGLVAFLDVLYIANGQVHAPSLEAIKGLVSNVPYDSLVTALKKEPAVFLHAVVVNLTIRLTAAESYETRGTALLVLQRILPFVGDMHGRKILSPEAVDLMSHLVPIDVPWHSPRNQQVNALSEDQSLVKLSRVLSAWSTSLAAHLCELIAAEDPFYYAITPLLSDAASASDLLPFLVQACLSCGSEKSIKERVRLLSDHLSSVLQYSSAGIETVRAILKIILHLRHFHPPYRPDLLGYNAWLKIDFLLLSEAAIKCGAFATALLFLESAVPSDNLDLYNSRVQKVCESVSPRPH